MNLYSSGMPDPLTVMVLGAFMTTSPSGLSRLRNDTSASITWSARTVAPTRTLAFTDLFQIQPSVVDPVAGLTGALEWADLAKAVFGQSRSLKDWEREALDEFTWSELES